MVAIDMERVLAFLTAVLRTPSPTGYHQQAIALVEDELRALTMAGLSVSRTLKGALVATMEGRVANRAGGWHYACRHSLGEDWRADAQGGGTTASRPRRR